MSIVACELCKSFGSAPAVDGVSFDIPAGGIVGLIGPNGAGKSTILRILATFLRPNSGKVAVAGFDCAEDAERVRGVIGYLPETLPGQSESRVEEYLAYRAQLKGIGRRERRQEVDRCLDECQLSQVRRRLIGRLSQGFRRRVGLADALLGRPRVLLLDEPTIGLDPLQVRHVRDVLTEFSCQGTILLSTHLLAEAEALCQRVLVLMQGKLVSDVSLAELHARAGFEIEIDAPRDECARMLQELPQVASIAVVGSDGRWHTFAVAAGGIHVRELAARECLRRGWGLRELHGLSGTLEDHFIRLAVRGRKEAA